MRGLALACLALALAACASPLQRAAAPGQDEQLLLVMVVETAPPRFQPGAAEPAGYSGTPVRARSLRVARALAREYSLQLETDWPMPALGVRCFVLSAPPSASPEALASALEADPRVESAQPVQRFHTSAYDDPYAPLQPSVRELQLPELHRVATGKGVKVAQIDTGVDWLHPDLAGRVAARRNFVDGSPYRVEIHGTAVAGIIAARANDGVGIVGVAPDATLLALRACWAPTPQAQSGVCNTFTLAKALQYALSERAQVINLSLTGPRDRLLERLLEVAARRGVVLVGAAGDATAGFPAASAHVIAVATRPGSESTPALLTAPGARVLSTLPGGTWGYVSGSSFAAAHVSGVAAVLLERVPGLTPGAIRQALSPPESNPHAMIDPCAALAQVAGGPGCACCATASVLEPAIPDH
jgi:subtilisin family serine protease